MSGDDDARPAGPGETAWAALLLVLGAVALGLTYRGALAVAVLVGVVVLGVLLVVAGRVLRLSAVAVMLAALGGLVLVTTLLLRAGGGEGRPWELLADAVPRLVTGPRPAPTAADLLAPAVLLAGVLAVLVGVRLGRVRRTRVSPPAAAVVLQVAAAALTAGAADRFGVLAAATVVVAVLGWGLLGRTRGTPSPAVRSALRPVAAGVGALALVVVPVVVGTAVLARDDAFDPREVVEPPVTDLVVANPMPLLDAWARDPGRELFTVSGSVFPLRLAVLSEYDGAAWAAPSAFRPLGEGRPALPAGQRQARVDARVTLVGVPAPWLPVGGAPESVDRTGALVDVESGTVVDPRAASGTTYESVGLVDAPTLEDATRAGLPDPETVPGLLATPGLPPALRDYAASAVAGASTPFSRAKAVEAAVRGSRTLDPESPGGSSYRRLSTFLLGDEGTSGAQRGGSEQFASAFAVLARSVGLPTRVVVGFTPGSESAPGGVRTVRGEDALAWPEVYLTGAGWVPFSPTPDVAALGPEAPDDTPIPSAPPTPGPVPSTAVTVEVEGESAAVPGPDLAPLALGGALVLVLAAAPLVVLAGLRARRRARHRRTGARGAWSELLDVAGLAGMRTRPGQDARELAAVLDARSGADGAAAEVLAAAETAAWAPPGEHGGRRSGVWPRVRVVSKAVRRTAPAPRRAVWAVSPGPLRDGRSGDVRPSRRRNVPAPQRLRDGEVVTDHEARWAPRPPARRED